MSNNKYISTFIKLDPVFKINDGVNAQIHMFSNDILKGLITDDSFGDNYTWRELYVAVKIAYTSGGFNIDEIAKSSNKHKVIALCKEIVRFYNNGNSGKFTLNNF